MLWKCCTQYASKSGKLSSGHRTGKGQFSFLSQRKAIPKNAQTTHTIALISHASKVMLKILQVRLQQYVNCELPDVQGGFRKGRGLRDQIANMHWIIEKAREFQKKQKTKNKKQKTTMSTLLIMPKPFTVWITTNNYGKFLKRWEYQTTWPASWEICMQVKKQQLYLVIEQQTGSKSGKEYIKAVYCHTAYLSYMQSMSCEMPDWMKHKLESRFLGEIWITSDMQMKPPLWQKVKKN